MKKSPSLTVDAQIDSPSETVPVQERELQLLVAFLPEVLKEFSRIQEEQQEE